MLVGELERYFDLKAVNQVVRAIYKPAGNDSKSKISGFAPVVAQSATMGDAVSQEILKCAGHQLGLSAATVTSKLGLSDHEFELALVGGVYRAGELIVTPVRDTIHQVAPRARVFVSDRPPVLGAARLALREIGRDVALEIRSEKVQSILGIMH